MDVDKIGIKAGAYRRSRALLGDLRNAGANFFLDNFGQFDRYVNDI